MFKELLSFNLLQHRYIMINLRSVTRTVYFDCKTHKR